MNAVVSSEFEKELRKIHGIWKTDLKYNATRFIEMIDAQGGFNTAKSLLANSKHPEGLTRLWQEKRLDISMEAIVIKSPWNTLFTPAELKIARKRLNDLGYKEI